LGEDAKFFFAMQFTVDREASGNWQVLHNSAATNQTMLNGKAVDSMATLKAGDVLGVGNEAKGIVKLPLTVRLV